MVRSGYVLVFTLIDRWVRLKQTFTGQDFAVMAYPGGNVRCPNEVAVQALTNFKQQHFELFIFGKLPGRHAESFIPDFEDPIHFFPNWESADSLQLAMLHVCRKR